ncbi:retinol dehydrogenase 14-like [Hyalella azteca]|uniref:Retinol dehydrogenase 14-like n=1 Tax=Hyalella azteca TaxID=294128 RepID=A0A979FR60_HYAAZ|nr:retinol dehydrogenase 14-like [Hyalella azteca]
MVRTSEQGAQTTLYLALSEEGGRESGCYYEKCRKTRLYRKVNDMELAKKLWQESSRLVELSDERPSDVETTSINSRFQTATADNFELNIKPQLLIDKN